MANKKMRKASSAMAKNWEAGKDFGFAEAFDPGNYVFKFQGYEMLTTKNGDDMVKTEHLCRSGERKGETCTVMYVLNNPVGCGKMRKFIQDMGLVDQDDPDLLEETLEEMSELAPIYTATVTRDDKYNDLESIVMEEDEDDNEDDDDDDDDDNDEEEDEDDDEEDDDNSEEDEDDDDDDLLQEEDIMDLDDDELKDFIKDNKLKMKVPKKINKKFRKSVVDAAQDAGYWDMDDDDDDNKSGSDSDDSGGDDFDELSALAEVVEVNVSKRDTYKTLAKKIAKYTYEKDEFEKEEVKLLKKIGATVE